MRHIRLVLVLALGAGCGFHRDRNALDANPVADTQGVAIDATDDATFDAPGDGPRVCSTTGMICPGSTPQLLACGGAADCWVGCRDGTPITHAMAAQHCASWGGRLTPLVAQSELDCVRGSINGAIWLGLVQAPGQSADDIGWSWGGDGQAPGYLFWDAGQPNDGDGTEDDTEQCAYSSTGSAWHDTPCDTLFSRFTCRYP